MVRKYRFAAVLASTVLLFGCTMRSCSSRQDIPPEDQLHAYISRAVDITKMEQRQELVDLTTGPLKSALVNASEESFKRAYIDKRYDFRSFEIIEKREVEPAAKVQLDFKLIYKAWNAGENPERIPLTETVNRATLEYVHGQWAISSVENVNTSMDWEVGMPLDNVSTQGVKETDPPAEIQSSREQGNNEQGNPAGSEPAPEQK